MKNFINQQILELDINQTPLTKELLMNYVINDSEGIVEPTDEYLKMELLSLFNRDLLAVIFISEWVYTDRG